ncbi:zinc-binding domain-containing protein [Dactylonectria macrodidyma]|uniref:Zinc-binding domain-containing protein n=1 Tax=Dactylonectria macrodidyma TaxID=307937 RepID=A0A9P9ES33_9HYPO|nr:zinc-binding domain-containing protein [Dactylonectria macrodidyma]
MPHNNGQKWFMFPNLHDGVSHKLAQDNLSFQFYEVDDDVTCINVWDTNVTGRFACKNHKCKSKGWPSKKIAVTIRMYSEAQYNVRVYSQRCRTCNSLSRPRLDAQVYVDRVTYRLKKWSGLHVEPPPFSGEHRGDHETRLCEGCRAGHCTMGNV